MNVRIKQINENLKPYYSLLSMIGFFLMLFISAYKFIISPSDLKITIQNERISYPSSIGNYYQAINNFLIKRDTLEIESLTIYNFLLKTTDFKSITLKNTSSKTLRGVKFKQLNTDALTAYSVSSDYLTNSEVQVLYKNLTFDELRNIIYFNMVFDIAPNSQINISVWGNFKDAFINNDLIVSYDNGEGHIEQNYNVSGLKGYFVNYSFEFFVIILFIFIAVYYVGLKYAKKR